MKMQLPSVDILIAAKNEERYIGSCLMALEAQDYPKELLQIYVIDNASSDNTVRIAERCGAHVLSEGKRGAAAVRNAGLAHSRGELVGFLDAHCVPEKEWVRLMAAQFTEEVLGGCQGSIENRSVDRRVQKYLDDTGHSLTSVWSKIRSAASETFIPGFSAAIACIAVRH